MCSVVGCESGRLGVQPQRFSLPEDPERRLEWVQFLLKVNGQRLKESSWTDIAICSDHFTDDCFEDPTPSHSGRPGGAELTLKSSAVPSLSPQSGSDRPEPHLRIQKCAETTEVACELDKLQTCAAPTSCSEDPRVSLSAAQRSPFPQGVSTDTEAVMSVYGQMHPKNVDVDLIREKAELLRKKRKYVVNEKRLFQLFSCNCPFCGSKMKLEKVTQGLLIVLNQHCLPCDYRKQWKSQADASVPTAEGTDVTQLIQQAAPPAVPEIDAVVNEENDAMEDSEVSGDEGDMESDEDWTPVTAKAAQKDKDKKTQNKAKEKVDEPPPVRHNSQLCTECGVLFNKLRGHTCEHKIKPYSCNICGKRCVNEFALNSHSKIHDENYEFRCKFCHLTFKLKADKFGHEQIHSAEEEPYKCPDCSETFPSNKARKIHLEVHRGPRETKCHICGIEFYTSLALQRHLHVHTGERPFKCNVCDRGFNQASHLKSHMRLHTGERPFKCQYCDKRFNHNVSLKSHVQRYHASNSRVEQTKEKLIDERECDADDTEGNGNKTGADSDVMEEDDTDEAPKMSKRSTGRPIGRPKRKESGSLVLAVQVEGLCSKAKTRKKQVQQSKGTEDEEEEDKSKCDRKKVTGSTSRLRGKPENSDSDSDFDPKDRKKKKTSSQKSGTSSGKRRGRQRKEPVE